MLLAPDHRVALQILESPRRTDLLITNIVMLGHVNGFALASMTAYEVETEEAVGKVLRKQLSLERLVIEVALVLAEKNDTSG